MAHEQTHSTQSEEEPKLSRQPSISPDPVVKRVSHVMGYFVKRNEALLTKSLQKLHVKMSFDIDDASGVGFIHILPLKGSEKVINWNEECNAMVELFLQAFSETLLPVHSEILPKVQEIVRKNESNPSLCVRFTENLSTLNVAGHSTEVSKLVKEIELIEEKEVTREESVSLDEKRIVYVQAKSNDLREEYPNIHFTINTRGNAVIISGKKEDVEEFTQVLRKLKVFSSQVNIADETLAYLSSLDDQTIINKLLQDQEETFAVYFDEEFKLFILAAEKPTATKLAKHLTLNIDCITIKHNNLLDEDKKFSALCEQITEKYDVYINMSSTEILVIGRCKHTEAVKEKLEQYIQEEYFGKRTIKVSQGRWRFISKHLNTQWNKITSKLEDTKYQYVVSTFPSITDDNPIIVLEGEEALITVLYEEIIALIESVCTNDPPMHIDRPGLFEYLSAPNGDLAVKGIESQIPACIKVTITALESDEFTDNDANKANEICKGTTKEGKQITLIEEDIENFKVDVMVNAANGELSHHGGVALAISKKGGPKIQKDSNNFIKLNGTSLLDGDAVIRDEVGNLPCKKLIHAVGPVWRGGGHIEDRVLKKTCMNSLRLAQKYKSISFPAISSGLFKFPLHVCANTMIETFCAWSEEFPNATLQYIYIVIRKSAAQVFTDAMKKQLNVFPQYHHSVLSATTDATTFTAAPSRWRRKNIGNSAVLDNTPSVASVTSTQKLPIEVHQGKLLQQKVRLDIKEKYHSGSNVTNIIVFPNPLSTKFYNLHNAIICKDMFHLLSQ